MFIFFFCVDVCTCTFKCMYMCIQVCVHMCSSVHTYIFVESVEARGVATSGAIPLALYPLFGAGFLF